MKKVLAIIIAVVVAIGIINVLKNMAFGSNCENCCDRIIFTKYKIENRNEIFCSKKCSIQWGRTHGITVY